MGKVFLRIKRGERFRIGICWSVSWCCSRWRLWMSFAGTTDKEISDSGLCGCSRAWQIYSKILAKLSFSLFCTCQYYKIYYFDCLLLHYCLMIGLTSGSAPETFLFCAMFCGLAIKLTKKIINIHIFKFISESPFTWRISKYKKE